MRRIILALLLGIFLSTLVYAETASDEMSSREFSELRGKIRKMKREMDLLMKDVISSPLSANDTLTKDFNGDVNIDMLQTERNIVVKADLPGMQKDKIEITLEGNRLLKIAGSRDAVRSEKSPGVVRQERFSGHFEKVLELPTEVENTGINATYKDGVLEITIPKKSVIKEEKLKIGVK